LEQSSQAEEDVEVVEEELIGVGDFGSSQLTPGSILG